MIAERLSFLGMHPLYLLTDGNSKWCGTLNNALVNMAPYTAKGNKLERKLRLRIS